MCLTLGVDCRSCSLNAQPDTAIVFCFKFILRYVLSLYLRALLLVAMVEDNFKSIPFVYNQLFVGNLYLLFNFPSLVYGAVMPIFHILATNFASIYAYIYFLFSLRQSCDTIFQFCSWRNV